MAAFDWSVLPKDRTFWIVLAGVLGVVVVLAVIFNRGVKLGSFFSLERGPEKKMGDVSVAREMKAKGLEVGGSVTGVKGDAAPGRNVVVLEKADLTDTTIHGDISGVTRTEDPNKKE
jgi:hypothetical protein